MPIPYNKLECPTRAPKPKPRVVAAKEKAKEAEEEKGEAKKAEGPKPLPKPIARSPEQERCTAYREEPGQTRRRSGSGSRACTRVLVHRTRTEQVVAENRPRPVEAPVPKDPSEVLPGEVWRYEDWRQTPEETARLDRAYECLQGVCHARHQNFIPKDKKKPAGKHNGQSLSTGSGSGGGASAPRPAPKTTTVKTTTKSVSKPNGTASGQAGPSGGTTAGSAVVPEGRRIPNDELKAPPAKRGKAPTGNDGHPVELHHRGQKPDSPLDEMTRTEHRGQGNFSENHSNTGQEPSKIDRKSWKEQQRRYWTKEHDRGRFDGKKQ